MIGTFALVFFLGLASGVLLMAVLQYHAQRLSRVEKPEPVGFITPKKSPAYAVQTIAKKKGGRA